jgi:CheY-like chemotaxis protein
MEALAAFDRAVPDVLVSDVAMPEQDGYALIRAVRRRAATQGGAVPAIAVSGYAAPEDRERALAAGFERHLSKPLGVQMLIREVAAAVGRTMPA